MLSEFVGTLLFVFIATGGSSPSFCTLRVNSYEGHTGPRSYLQSLMCSTMQAVSPVAAMLGMLPVHLATLLTVA